MGTKYDFDYIIIGSGAAGGTAALMAASAGKSVALIEAGKWGGSSLNTRDIPFAAAVRFSNLYFEAKEGARFGISSDSLRFNYPTALHWGEVATRRAGANSKKRFEEAGITCIRGLGHFISPDAISVGSKGELRAKKFIIATGTTPKVTGITGVDTVKCLQPEEVATLERLPKVALVVGGGASGCEVAEYLGELGVKVILIELSSRILPHEDMEVAEVLEKRFSKKLGIKVITGARVAAIQENNGIKRVIFIQDGREKSVKVEEVVLATGSTPATDMGLENAHVKYSGAGIKVDKSMMTSTRHIFAAGDVADTGTMLSSIELASYEAAVAFSASLGKAKGIADFRGFVRLTNTFPQIASVGLTEDDCVRRDLKYHSTVVPLTMAPAANIYDFKDGFVKLLANREKKVIGATVVCPNAEAVIQEIVLAMRTDIKLIDLATAPHANLCWGELVRIAARRLA